MKLARRRRSVGSSSFSASSQPPRRRRRALPRLKVSENRHFLVYEDGRPFFYLGDTAWELFHRLDREEADRYLQDRARKGFTVIQAVALAELDGLSDPNAYGHLPLLANDPERPDVKEGPANDYWDHVDFVVERANALGLYVGFLPTWGDKWNKKWGQGPEIFTPGNAAAYGEWLGRRYKDHGVIWILGGDRPVETEAHKEVLRAMAGGLRKGDGGAHLMTFHPTGGSGSSEPFHDEDWLDFNMRQNGHIAEFTGRYDATRADYDRTPAKPVLDGEPIYEDHPVSFEAAKFGHSIAADVRRPLYWDLFSGACGHTYGHHSVWQMWAPGRKADQQPAPALVRGDRPARGRPDAARPAPPRVAPSPHARPRRHGGGRGPRSHRDARSRTLPFRGDARQRGTLRHGLRAGRKAVHGEDDGHQGPAGQGLVVRSARRQGHADRRVRERRRALVHPARPRRAPRLGARARRRGAGLPAARGDAARPVSSSE